MATFKLDFALFAEQQRKLAQEFMPAVKRGMLAGAMQSIVTLHRRTRSAPPANPAGIGSGGAVDTGRYLQSWKIAPLPNGVRIYNAAPYAGVIEDGRRAGARMPPRQVIERWLRRRTGMSAKDAKAAAYPVARAIARRGLIPRRVLGNALTEINEIISKDVKSEINKAIAALTGTTP